MEKKMEREKIQRWGSYDQEADRKIKCVEKKDKRKSVEGENNGRKIHV